MKRIILLFILTIFISIISAQEIEEIAITPTTAMNQNNPMLASSDNCFFINWEDYRVGASNPNIYGISVEPDATTSSFLILCVETGLQNTPVVEYDSGTNKFMNIWFDQRTATQLYAINSTCSDTSGNEWFVDDITSNLSSPEIAFSGMNYLYVWMYNNAGSYEIRYLVLDNTGSPAGVVQTLSATGIAKYPDVAYDGYEFIIVWEDSTASGKGIYGKYFNSSGSSLSSSFLLVNDGFASASAVCGIEGTVASNSKFAIAYQHYDGTTNNDIYAGKLDHLSTSSITGNAVCTENTAQSEPDIGWHNDGFLVVWKDARPGFSTDIYARFLDTLGTPTDTDFVICDATSSQRTAKLAYNSSANKYFCVWTDGRNGSNDDIYGALINIPKVVVIQPNGSESWAVGTTQQIQWTSAWVENVKIEYSTDNGGSWVSPSITSSTPSDGSYNWTIPNTPSSQCLVKITSADNPNILDISNATFTITEPDTFQFVGELDNISATKKVEVSGNYAFLPARYNSTLSLLAVDVSDSSNPTIVAATAIPNAAYGMGLEIIDTLVCLSTSDGYLHIFDFNTDTLVLIGSYDIDGQGAEVVGRDTMVWVCAYDTIRWLGISDPTAPYQLATFAASSQFKGLCLRDTFLFSTEGITTGGSRFRILRANDPAQFWPAGGSGSVTMNGYGEDVDGDYTTGYMFVADGVTQATSIGRMIPIDVSTISSPDSIGIFQSNGATIKGISVDDTLAYLSNDTLGVKITDVTDPTNPSLAFTIEPPANKTLDVFVYGRFLYVLADSNLFIYRINIGGPSLSIQSWVFGDSSDGDGYFEPGETLGLTVIVENTGTEIVNSAWMRASILSGDGTVNPPDSIWFGNIAVGAKDTAYFDIIVGSGAATPSQIRVQLAGHSSNGGNPTDVATADIVDASPVMEITSWVFGDSSDGDGYFEVGEILGLTIEVKNTGLDVLHNTWVRTSILLGDGSILPPDSVYLGNIIPDNVDTAYFDVKISNTAPTPSQLQVLIGGHSFDGGEPKDTAIADIVDVSPTMEITSWVFGDSSDGDSRFEPGETLGLTVVVENIGLDVLHNAWIRASVLSGDCSLEIPDSIWVGNLNVSQQGTVFYYIVVDTDAIAPSTIEILLSGHSSDGGEPVDTAAADIVPRMPAMAIISWVFTDSSDEDGRFEPGETLGLTVVVEDTGSDPLHNAWIRASVLSGDCSLEIPDSIWVGNLNVSQQGTVFYYIVVDTDAIAPSTIEILLSGHSSDGGEPVDTAAADIVSGTGGFYDDMESGPSNWFASGHWHIDNRDASSPTLAWFCAYANEPIYNSNWDDTLISKWITVTDNSWLIVHHRYNTEDNYDTCSIDLTTGGGWFNMDKYTGTSSGWIRNSYDLSSLSAGDSVRVRFRLDSDGSVIGNGWWVDDVYVGEAQTADLYGPRCYPNVAYFQDSILFTINYQRDDGTYPTSANVYVGDSIVAMNTVDIDPSDGAIYYCKTKLPPWNYSHHFEFVVPEGTVRFPKIGEIDGPYVNDTVVIYWNFEDGGHATGTGCWQYGTPTSGPGSAYSGSNLWGTVLNGNYPNNSISVLRFDSFDLTGLEHPQVRMWLWYSMQSRTSRTGFRDAANAWVIHGTDTTFLNQIYEYPGIASGYLPNPVRGKPAWGDNDRGNFWHRVMFDLSQWVGDTIEFAIVFESSNSTSDAGIYVDNLALLDEFDEPPIIAFTLNSEDSIFWQKETAQREQTLVSNAADSIAVDNTGNITLDFILGIFDIDTINFDYDTSSCYGCVSLWGYFSDDNIVPDTTQFDSLDWIRADTLLLSDTLHYGPAGWGLLPDSQDYFWLMMRTPQYFSEDTFTARIFIKALQHIE